MSNQQEKVEVTLRYMSLVSDPPPGKTKSRTQFVAVVADRAHLEHEEVEPVLDTALDNLKQQGVNVDWTGLQTS